jgi:hypothetical protein
MYFLKVIYSLKWVYHYLVYGIMCYVTRYYIFTGRARFDGTPATHRNVLYYRAAVVCVNLLFTYYDIE